MIDAGAPPLKIGKPEITSRLFVGTGKYASYELMRDALAQTGCQVVTVAVRTAMLGQELLQGLDSPGGAGVGENRQTS